MSDVLLNFIAGGVGGSCTVIVGHPFDTVKVWFRSTFGKMGLFLVVWFGNPLGLVRRAEVSSSVCPYVRPRKINGRSFTSQATLTILFCPRYHRKENGHLREFMLHFRCGFKRCRDQSPASCRCTRVRWTVWSGRSPRRASSRSTRWVETFSGAQESNAPMTLHRVPYPALPARIRHASSIF